MLVNRNKIVNKKLKDRNCKQINKYKAKKVNNKSYRYN